MRERIIEIEHSHEKELRSYQGNAGPLASVKHTLSSLMETAAPRKLSSTQKRLLAGALGALIVILLGCGLFTNWVWQMARLTPPPPVFIFQPAATLTIAPSATASSTSTLTPFPTATQTFAPSPPAPFIGVILGDVWMHTDSSSDSARSGAILTTGEQVELLALDGEWAQVRKIASGQSEVTGWIPVRWLGVTTSIPARLITPSATP